MIPTPISESGMALKLGMFNNIHWKENTGKNMLRPASCCVQLILILADVALILQFYAGDLTMWDLFISDARDLRM